MRRPSNMSKKTGQTDLEEYIFTRPEMARLLGISTNALRMRMRKGRCDLDYRFDGKQFKFKRPAQDRVISMMENQPKTIQKKTLNRGATHRGKGNYPNEAFKQHNEMKILNSIQGKFKSGAHRKEFDNLNKEALKKAQENLQIKEQKELLGQFKRPDKYGTFLNAKGLEEIDKRAHIKLNNEFWSRYDYSDQGSGSVFFGTFGQKQDQEKDAVDIDTRDLPPDDKEPEFRSKVQESIWRAKYKK